MTQPDSITQLSRRMDLHLHRPDLASADIQSACMGARHAGFAAVSVHGSQVELTRHHLEESDVKVAAVVGFPFGGMDADAKRYETEAAIDVGAQEIEAVINIGRLKERDSRFLLRELRDIVEAADERPVKIIIETSLLTRDETLLACDLIPEAGAKCLQTGTGTVDTPVTVEEVKFLREALGPKFGLKACGKIDETRTAVAMIEAGANRVGTSKGVSIADGVILTKADSF
jgi:deoxyribose-phosphate aldolase